MYVLVPLAAVLAAVGLVWLARKPRYLLFAKSLAFIICDVTSPEFS